MPAAAGTELKALERYLPGGWRIPWSPWVGSRPCRRSTSCGRPRDPPSSSQPRRPFPRTVGTRLRPQGRPWSSGWNRGPRAAGCAWSWGSKPGSRSGDQSPQTPIGKKKSRFFLSYFSRSLFFANLQLVVLGPVALGALEAPLVVGLSLLDHLLGVEHRTPATRAPGLGTTIAGPAVLNQLGAAADRRGLDATGLDQGGVGVDLGTVVPDEWRDDFLIFLRGNSFYLFDSLLGDIIQTMPAEEEPLVDVAVGRVEELVAPTALEASLVPAVVAWNWGWDGIGYVGVYERKPHAVASFYELFSKTKSPKFPML